MARRTKEDVKALTDKEMLEIADNETSRIGYDLIAVKNLPHEDDCYLKIVMGHNKKKEKYATWVLNLESGGLHGGHYFDYWFGTEQESARLSAWDDYLERD